MRIEFLDDDKVVARDETCALVSWLGEEQFQAPIFSWRALSVDVRGGGPGMGYGLGGFFYRADGRWSPALTTDTRHQHLEMEEDIFERWIEATTAAFRKTWEAALIEVIRGPGTLQARVSYDFCNMERWRECDGLLGDFLRPRELPTPMGSGLL